MAWIRHESGLILPNEALPNKAPLAPILLFIDETFTADKSGFLQACFSVPQSIYDETFVPRSRELLRQLGSQAAEFKGSAIKRGNIRPYRDFLHLFIGVSAHVSDHAPLYPVVSLEGNESYAGQQFDWVRKNVEGSLQNFNVSDSAHIVEEFSQQLIWLHSHLTAIAPEGISNEIVFTFDEKHSYAKQMLKLRFFSGEQPSAAVASSLETVLTSLARTLFSHKQSNLRLTMIDRVKRFRFARSQDEFGLQAADVLSHLIYISLRKAVGIVNANTSFKVDLLSEIMPDFAIDDDLRSRLKIIEAKDGRQDISLTDPLMRLRFHFAPDDTVTAVHGPPSTPSTSPESATPSDEC